MTPFIERLQNSMKKLDINAAELAEKSGISKARISQYINGIYEPKSKGIHALALALDVADTYLLGYNVDEKGNELNSSAECEKLTEAEQDLIDKYRALPDWMQRLARENINALYREKIEYDRIQKENEA